MPKTAVSPDSLEAMTAALRRVEERLEMLEQWRGRIDNRASIAGESGADTIPDAGAVAVSPADAPGSPKPPIEESDKLFDLALIGRTLIVFGGAYLLRALTEGGFVPAAVGVLIGSLYAVLWSLLSLRPSVTRESAAWHGVATAFISLPLIFEAVRKFEVFGPWSAALAMTLVTAILGALVCRYRLEGLAWTFTLMALASAPLLMLQTESMVPFTFYLTALGVATVWLGYEFEWSLLRWVVAIETDVVLVVLSMLVATGRLPDVSPAIAITVVCLAFITYLTTFAVRTLLRQREAVPFEIAQTTALLVLGLGGAMWMAASRGTLEIALGVGMIAQAAGSYAVSFAFIPRHFATPRNFVFYSSLALMLMVAGGAFIALGLPSSILFGALAVTCGYFAAHFQKSSLALHAAVYLFSGFAGAGLVQLGFSAFVLKLENGWQLPGAGTAILLAACAIAAGIRPIERQGNFELWTAAKVMILAELGWIGATLFMSVTGLLFLNDPGSDPAVIAVTRTAVLAGLTILTAWASRFPTLSPARLLCNPLMVMLALKLMWEDFRVGRPGTLFISLAIVGIALILTPRLRRAASPPQSAGSAASGHALAPDGAESCALEIAAPTTSHPGVDSHRPGSQQLR